MVSNRRALFLYRLEINRIEQIHRFKRGTTPLSAHIDSKRSAEISRTELRRTTFGVKSLIGKDVKKYQILWNNMIIFAADNPQILRFIYREENIDSWTGR